jgi:two-component system nitrate/nitrite response regulator NarL
MQAAAPGVKLLIVDDHRLLRKALIGLLSEYSSFQIAGEADNGMEALTILQKTEVDVVVLDDVMPVMDGFTALVEIKKQYPKTRVIMFVMSEDEQREKKAYSLGVDSYLSKDSAPEEIIKRIKSVCSKTSRCPD